MHCQNCSSNLRKGFRSRLLLRCDSANNYGLQSVVEKKVKITLCTCGSGGENGIFFYGLFFSKTVKMTSYYTQHMSLLVCNFKATLTNSVREAPHLDGLIYLFSSDAHYLTFSSSVWLGWWVYSIIFSFASSSHWLNAEWQRFNRCELVSTQWSLRQRFTVNPHGMESYIMSIENWTCRSLIPLTFYCIFFIVMEIWDKVLIYLGHAMAFPQFFYGILPHKCSSSLFILF